MSVLVVRSSTLLLRGSAHEVISHLSDLLSHSPGVRALLAVKAFLLGTNKLQANMKSSPSYAALTSNTCLLGNLACANPSLIDEVKCPTICGWQPPVAQLEH